MNAEIISAISEAIREVASLMRELVAGSQMRRMRYRLEAAEEYVFIDEKSGKYVHHSDARRRELKAHFRKRIFDEA